MHSLFLIIAGCFLVAGGVWAAFAIKTVNAEIPEKIIIRDVNLNVIKTLEKEEDLRAFSGFWQVRKKAKAPVDVKDWTYFIDIEFNKDDKGHRKNGGRWRYDGQEYVTKLGHKAAPVYEMDIDKKEAFNMLLNVSKN